MQQTFRMIDVGEKQVTRRRAVARGSIKMAPETMEMIRSGNSPKGNILAIAEVAGIMAAKNTAQVIPLCHPLQLDRVSIWFEVLPHDVTAFCEVICHGKTGVEMEALVGVNATLLTIYDLAKAVDPVIEISDIYLDTKEGGKSGLWRHPKTTDSPKNLNSKQSQNPTMFFAGLRFAVGVLSDRASQEIYSDRSGPLIIDYFKQRSATQVFYKVIADDSNALTELVFQSKKENVDVLLLSGGTGLSPRDITPDVLKTLTTRELVGFGELQRQYGARFTKSSWLSRSSAYIVDQTLVVLFPGSPKAVQQGLECLGELIPHAIRMLRGEGHGYVEKSK